MTTKERRTKDGEIINKEGIKDGKKLRVSIRLKFPV
jgi:hypothetical protein